MLLMLQAEIDDCECRIVVVLDTGKHDVKFVAQFP